MQVQVNADSSVEAHASLVEQAEAAVEAALGRFGERITRVEVYLKDVNRRKSGQDDKRCMIEARPAGRPPVAVSHYADTFPAAITGAADKLERLLDSTLGREKSH